MTKHLNVTSGYGPDLRSAPTLGDVQLPPPARFLLKHISETGTSLCPVHSGIMRRYHFHIIDGLTIFDNLGTKLPDDKAARDHAEKVADYFNRNEVFHGAAAVRVTNDLGEVVFRMPFNHRPIARGVLRCVK